MRQRGRQNTRIVVRRPLAACLFHVKHSFAARFRRRDAPPCATMSPTNTTRAAAAALLRRGRLWNARASPTARSTPRSRPPSAPTAKAGRRHPLRLRRRATSSRREPNPHDEATLARPAFARDIEKILNVPAYNRYADKTQVFSFVENDDICRRGLHVQLVSRIARGIGSAAGAELRAHRGHRARARRGPHAVRARGRALPVAVLPCAHRALLQPQRALRARARPAVPPQREPADARRRALPQRRVRPAGAARGRAPPPSTSSTRWWKPARPTRAPSAGCVPPRSRAASCA